MSAGVLLMGKWTRRVFLTSGGLVGGGLALGIAGLTFAPNRLTIKPRDDAGHSRLNTWVRIAPDNIVTVVLPHCEMGQGVHTALAMMLAEELDADWHLIRIEEAPATGEFANGYLIPVFMPFLAGVPQSAVRGIDFATFKMSQLLPLQVTGGSSSVRGTGHRGLRIAGAAARSMLVTAAAKQWNVSPAECTARASIVMHAPSSRSVTYGEIAAAAALLDTPAHPQLKSRDKYTLVGKAQARLDIPSKVDGTATYGIDVALPQMLYATVAAAPVFGATVSSVDSVVAQSMVGVRKIVNLGNAVAVVADSYWRALKALRACVIVFAETPAGQATTQSLFELFDTTLQGEEQDVVHASGNVEKSLSAGVKRIQAEYRVPFLAHAAMEPLNAVACVSNGRCEVWTGVQDPLAARKVAAQAAGLEAASVTLHNYPLGGGFGRRLPGAHDFVDQAVRIANAMSPIPVKLIWSREEDIQHDFYRTASLARLQGAIDEQGTPTSWHGSYHREGDLAAVQIPYAIANQKMQLAMEKHHIRLGAWRSVAHSQHGFFTESFIDELAHAADKDAFEYRRGLLAHKPRHRRVLERAASLAHWSDPLPQGRARGIALVECFGTVVAEVAEVSIVDGAICVHHLYAAVDCGEVINPDTARAQIEGGMIFGLSAALFSEITIAYGRVMQSNFNDYLLPRLADAPRLTVEFIVSDAPIGGLGEPGVPPVAPAIANALFVLTGKRHRSLPLRL